MDMTEERPGTRAATREGTAELDAAWARACELGLDGIGLTPADIAELLAAARQARARSGPPVHPAREMMRGLLAFLIRNEITFTETNLRGRLAEAGFEMDRDILHDWLAEDRAAISREVAREKP